MRQLTINDDCSNFSKLTEFPSSNWFETYKVFRTKMIKYVYCNVVGFNKYSILFYSILFYSILICRSVVSLSQRIDDNAHKKFCCGGGGGLKQFVPILFLTREPSLQLISISPYCSTKCCSVVHPETWEIMSLIYICISCSSSQLIRSTCRMLLMRRTHIAGGPCLH